MLVCFVYVIMSSSWRSVWAMLKFCCKQTKINDFLLKKKKNHMLMASLSYNVSDNTYLEHSF